MKLRAVKFLSSWQGYNAGEAAGFIPDRAKWLIEQGLAEPFLKTTSDPLRPLKEKTAARKRSVKNRKTKPAKGSIEK